jgi:hypothetical protein
MKEREHRKHDTKNDQTFSDQELQKLASSQDEPQEVLAKFLSSELGPLYRQLKKERRTVDLAYMCNVATEELRAKLRQQGFDSVIVEGEVEIAPHQWLAHRVNVVKLPKEWIVIDLTARQLPWMKGRSWLLEKIAPDETSLKQFLKERYRWWTGDVIAKYVEQLTKGG